MNRTKEEGWNLKFQHLPSILQAIPNAIFLEKLRGAECLHRECNRIRKFRVWYLANCRLRKRHHSSVFG